MNGVPAEMIPAEADLEPYQAPILMMALLAAKKSGCCVARGSVKELAQWLLSGYGSDRASDVEIVLSRSNDPPVQVLSPKTASDAPPLSQSAKFGTGAIPYHADGSHLDQPPHFVLLEAENSAEAPTHLLRIPSRRGNAFARDMRHGVFRVDAGGSAFYTTCRSSDSEALRFDLGCMSPIDPRSRRLTRDLTNAKPDYVHEWTGSGHVLIIDNRQVLHARANADNQPDRRLFRLMLNHRGPMFANQGRTW